MNFQEKLQETAAQLRVRASQIASTAVATARTGATLAADRLEVLKTAGQGLNEVTRRHASRFVKQNRALATAAGKDLRDLARSTYATLATATPSDKTAPAKARRKPAASRRTNKRAG